MRARPRVLGCDPDSQRRCSATEAQRRLQNQRLAVDPAGHRLIHINLKRRHLQLAPVAHRGAIDSRGWAKIDHAQHPLIKGWARRGGASYDRPMPDWLEQAGRIDAAVYEAIAQTPTPALDSSMRRLSEAADYSKPWALIAAALALFGGAGGRRAALRGLAALGAAATIANAVAKPLSLRARPRRQSPGGSPKRHVAMPTSTSFPSGHTASAFAFASGVGQVSPSLGVPLWVAAAAVGYSRVHTGVHYPGDVLAGAFLGVSLAELTDRLLSSHAGGSR